MDKAVLLLFGTAFLFALPAYFGARRALLYSLLSALFTIAGILTGLVLGLTLERMLTPLLLLTAVSLLALTRKESNDEI